MKNNNSSGAFNSYYDRYEKNDINAIEITNTRVIELEEITEKHKLGYFRLNKQRQEELNYFAKKYKETNNNDYKNKAKEIFFLCVKWLALSPRATELYYKYFYEPMSYDILEEICDELIDCFDEYIEKYNPFYILANGNQQNGEYSFYPYFRINVFGNSNRNRPGRLNNYLKKLKQEKERIFSIDANGGEDGDSGEAREIPDNTSFDESIDNEIYKAFCNQIIFMMNIDSFKKHYKVEKSEKLNSTLSKRYDYFTMFYSADILIYLKCFPMLNVFLKQRSQKILNACDNDFFKYILILSSCLKRIDNLDAIENAEFKCYGDLSSNLFRKEILKEQIEIVIEEGKKSGLYKLKYDNMIYASYSNKTKANITQQNEIYKKYAYAFLKGALGA